MTIVGSVQRVAAERPSVSAAACLSTCSAQRLLVSAAAAAAAAAVSCRPVHRSQRVLRLMRAADTRVRCTQHSSLLPGMYVPITLTRNQSNYFINGKLVIRDNDNVQPLTEVRKGCCQH